MKKRTKVILGALGAAAAANCVHAAVYKPEKKTAIALQPETCDAERACERISQALQIPTISHPDKTKVDWSQFDRFHRFLEESYPLIHEKLEKEVVTDANLLFYWKGKNPDLEPIALLSHQDVVPVAPGTEEDWTYPAFSGHNDGEFIWGRGALDMKNHLIGVMEAVETLLEEGFEPERDVYLCFGCDEEVVGSENGGAKAMATLLAERGVHLDSVLDEGGAILPVHVKGFFDGYLAGVGIAEKGYADFEISLETKGGHSSQPPKHSGLGEMAKVISDLENHQFKAQVMPFLTDLFDTIGRKSSYPARLVLCNFPLLMPLVREVMKQIPPAASLIRSTTGVTMASGSPAANVLPQNASIVVNFRAMPGTSIADIEKHIHKVVRNKKIIVKTLKSKEASRFSSTDSRAFRVIESVTTANHPDAAVAPFLVMGGTDACYYEGICDHVYRFSPFIADTKLLLCTHGTDERLPVDSVGEAVVFFKRYIRALASE